MKGFSNYFFLLKQSFQREGRRYQKLSVNINWRARRDLNPHLPTLTLRFANGRLSVESGGSVQLSYGAILCGRALHSFPPKTILFREFCKFRFNGL